MDKSARKLSSPRKSCFGEYSVRSLQTFWPEKALPRYTYVFLQYEKGQDKTSVVTVSQTRRVNVSSLSVIFFVRSCDARIPVLFPDPGGSVNVRVVRSNRN